MTFRVPKATRHRPAKQTQWSDAAILRHRYLDLAAKYAALVASLPERDRVVAQATADRYAQQIAQRGADDAVAQLRERGLLRESPAQTATVKHVRRDEQGQITGIIERTEQVEP